MNKFILKRFIIGLFFMLILLYNRNALCEASAYVLMEEDTGRVLYAQNKDLKLPMASTTKVMTALLAIENADLNEKVVTSSTAFGVPGTSIYLETGEVLTMQDMLYGLMLQSGNDAAVAIAEHIAQTESNFAKLMTERARQIGCNNTCFQNAHGLPKEGHYATPYDLALITREGMKHDFFRTLVSTKHAKIPWNNKPYERVLTNKNKLLSTYEGATGVKTGYTSSAGRCLIFSAKKEDLSLIGVVLNCPDWFSYAERILDQGFKNYQSTSFYQAGDVVTTAHVQNGVSEKLPLITLQEVKAPFKNGREKQIVCHVDQNITAPVQKGQTLGYVMLKEDDVLIHTFPLVALESVDEQTFRSQFQKIAEKWGLRFSN